MPVFVVISKHASEKVREEIRKLPRGSTYELAENAWLVDFEGTTRGLAEAIGIRGRGSEEISGIAFPISNWSGRFTTDVWEWLELHATRGDL